MGTYILFAENPDLTQNSSATLTADRPEMQRTLTLYPGGAISGRVENEAGDPIPDARVYVAAYDIAGSRTHANRVRALGSQTESDETGAFTVRHLRRSGSGDQGYKLAVSAEGYALSVSDYIHSGTEDVLLVVRPGSSAYGQLV